MNLKKIENMPDKEGKSLRSKSTLYDKTKYIICQVPEVKLGMISVKETGEKMLEVAKKLDSPDFFLPNVEYAIENDTRYHLKCWVTIQWKL